RNRARRSARLAHLRPGDRADGHRRRDRRGHLRRRRRPSSPETPASRDLAAPAAAVVDRYSLSEIRGVHRERVVGHSIWLLDNPQERAVSRFKNEVAHLKAHIKALRAGAAALFAVALVLGFGWWSAPRD